MWLRQVSLLGLPRLSGTCIEVLNFVRQIYEMRMGPLRLISMKAVEVHSWFSGAEMFVLFPVSLDSSS